jgi:hypothetical protein
MQRHPRPHPFWQPSSSYCEWALCPLEDVISHGTPLQMEKVQETHFLDLKAS